MIYKGRGGVKKEGKEKLVCSQLAKVVTITYVIKITQTQVRKICPLGP